MRRENDWLRLTGDDQHKSKAFDGSVAMRRFLLAIMMFGTAAGAQAADMPDFLHGSLPGSTPTRNWDGWYAGGQGGYSSANMDFSQSLTGLTNNIFRDTVLQTPTSQLGTLGKANPQATGFGAFVGRNWQWDDIVLGVEANYNYINSFAGSSSNSIGPLAIVNPPGETLLPGATDTYVVTLKGTAAAQIKDVVTLRGRAGWAIGDFLPYAFGGLAVGRMDVQRSVTSSTTKEVDITTTNLFGVTTTTFGTPAYLPSLSLTQSQERTNDFVIGWTGGLGFEYAIWNNVFIRAEWEYLKFVSVMNTSVTMNSARAGLGYKF
jgi:outer membrane immunogenic protein